MIPYIHAELSAKRYGGKPEDYLDIHELMDSTKGSFPNNTHRVITHNSWFVVNILPKVFGHVRKNSEGKRYNVKDVGEYHILEDYRMQFIPSIQDYLENMVPQPWMNNGNGTPNRCQLVFKNKREIEAYINGTSVDEESVKSDKITATDVEISSELQKLELIKKQIEESKKQLDDSEEERIKILQGQYMKDHFSKQDVPFITSTTPMPWQYDRHQVID